MNEDDEKYLSDHYRTRTNNYDVVKMKKGPGTSYIWSESLANKPVERSIYRLPDYSIVFAAQPLPSKPKRVVISGNLVIFIDYDRCIVIKNKPSAC